MGEIQVSAVAYQEDGVWIVQGIEYDIVAHASDAAALPSAFMRAVVENACITEHLGRAPLQGIKPAPARFKAMFDRAKAKVTAVGSEALTPKFGQIDIRLADQAAYPWRIPLVGRGRLSAN
jgi:hypothetical protein